MKVITITKKTLICILCCVLIGAIMLLLCTSTATQVIQTATTDRLIPIYYVDTKEKVCAISFDAAWGNEQTNELLDILDTYDVRTTFFLVGSWVDMYPKSVEEIYARGHEIGNHSDTHAHMTQISRSEQIAEIENCNKKISDITKNKVTLFRPPYGEYDNSVVESCYSTDMYCVQWNIDSLDWKDPSAEQITKNVVDKIQNGSIILLHNGAKNTPEALPMIIEGILDKGYEIVPISEILLKGDYWTDYEGRMHTTEQ